MKGNFWIAVCSGLLVIFGATLIFLTFAPARTAQVHSMNTKYCWYVMPQGEGVPPVVADNADFKDDYDVIYMGDTSEKKVWLTFDVGYDNGNTDKVLDALKRNDIQAAFFICGHVIDSCPELVKRMADEGHLVLNHTDTHKDLSGLSSEQIAAELCALEDEYYALTGDKMRCVVRPPEGNYSEAALKSLTDMGYTTMFWSFAYKDWLTDDQPSESDAIDTITSRAHPGMIALLHSTSATNAAVLDEAAARLEAEGYSFGSFSELGID